MVFKEYLHSQREKILSQIMRNFNLSYVQADVIFRLVTGETHREIAAAYKMSRRSTEQISHRIRKKIGLAKKEPLSMVVPIALWKSR